MCVYIRMLHSTSLHRYKAPFTKLEKRWINGVDEKAKVRLLQETGTSPLQPSGYEFTVQGDSGHHDWQTPSDLEPDASYAFQFIYQGGDDDEPAFSYSGRFSITGGNATHRRPATSSSSTKVSTAVIPGATTSSTSSSSSAEKKSNDLSDTAIHQQQQQDHESGTVVPLLRRERRYSQSVFLTLDYRKQRSQIYSPF
ncbi:predicted protein [Lichtheimia corymbifera JMRC:FSU:9682]|uniref:Uncharacterized protein n=1 Tax=Lichtheimia corymbifera JMRC:FSU:9682 TaxID=1263082 RepID=A0A068SFM9_9FUNG|nr:predicted protein [Lichtheimia corymbifera JMRC:FSU:9682]